MPLIPLTNESKIKAHLARGMKSGKAVLRVLPEASMTLQKNAVEALECRFVLSGTPEVWIEAYEAVESCMTPDAPDLWPFYSTASKRITLAILYKDDKIVARSLVCDGKHTKSYGERHYILDARLELLGIQFKENWLEGVSFANPHIWTEDVVTDHSYWKCQNHRRLVTVSIGQWEEKIGGPVPRDELLKGPTYNELDERVVAWVSGCYTTNTWVARYQTSLLWCNMGEKVLGAEVTILLVTTQPQKCVHDVRTVKGVHVKERYIEPYIDGNCGYVEYRKGA
jgi:hypothetical protein